MIGAAAILALSILTAADPSAIAAAKAMADAQSADYAHVEQERRERGAALAAKVEAKNRQLAAVAAAQDERERQLHAAAVKRAAEIDAAAEAIVSDPKAAQELISALLCDESQGRVEKLAKIAKDKKYSSLGGVVNLEYRASLQDDVEATDDYIAELRGELRARNLPALACQDKRVAGASACIFGVGEEQPGCRGSEAVMARVTELLNPRTREDNAQ